MIISEEKLQKIIRSTILEESKKKDAVKVLQDFLDTGKLDQAGQKILKKSAGKIDIEKGIKNGKTIVSGVKKIFQTIKMLLSKDKSLDISSKLEELSKSILKIPFEKLLGLISFGQLPFIFQFVFGEAKKHLEKMIRMARGQLYLMIAKPELYKIFKQAKGRAIADSF